jgi:hypothetical protein
MILPTKHLSDEKALLRIGAEVLSLLDEPKTVSRLWIELKQARTKMLGSASITYNWFILTLDLLYMLNTIDLRSGIVRRSRQ